MPGRPGLRSGGLLRLYEEIARTGTVRITGGGQVRSLQSDPRSFQLRRFNYGSELRAGGALRQPPEVPAGTSAGTVAGGGRITVLVRPQRQAIGRISGNGDIGTAGGIPTTVPATAVGSWRS